MALLTKEAENNIINILIAEGLVDSNLVQSVRTEVEGSGSEQSVLGELTRRGVANEDMVARATAMLIGVPYVELKNVTIEQDILSMIPQDAQVRELAIPLGEKDGMLNVAMADVTNVQATDYLSNLMGRPIRVWMSSEHGIREMIEKSHGDLTGVTEAVKEGNEEAAAEQSNVKTIVQDSPISKALTTILSYAAKTKASDIHIEPLESSLIIRCRIDGVLRRIMELPKNVAPALVSRVKILSNLKIDEHRVPQDGQFTVLVDGKEIDLRIAISPVTWGEQVVIRLLDKTGTSMEVDKMGMAGRALRDVLSGIEKPNGMILTSGPTGSGKSTTLYALIQKIKSEAINIVTLEDPVEYKMDGINQIQVNVDAGLTFASGLRSILRQDPDVVMVGEIRDSETAKIAIEAALTGHLVLSTLHTNDAPTAITRLEEMGVEPFLTASSLIGVLAQRLLRRLCKSCKEPYELSKEEVKNILPDFPFDEFPGQETFTFYKPHGCLTCNNTGYKGRQAVFEFLTVTEEQRQLILKRATGIEIRDLAMTQGMLTLRQDAMYKIIEGETSIEEMLRVVV